MKIHKILAVALNFQFWTVAVILTGVCVYSSISVFAQETVQVPDSGLMTGRVSTGGRNPIHTNAIESLIAAGQWIAPEDGTVIKLPDGKEQKWRPIKADENGNFTHNLLNRGYLYIPVESANDQTMLLHVRGSYGSVRINNTIRPGNPYNTGWIYLPVQLKQGTNDFLFQVYRGTVRMELTEPPADILLDRRDTTLPHLIIGEIEPVWGAMLLLNATNETQDNLSLLVSRAGGKVIETKLASVSPMITKKIGFQIDGNGISAAGTSEVTVELVRDNENVRESLWIEKFELSHVEPNASHNRTFVSSIDGSVQYYAIRPPKPPESPEVGKVAEQQPGMILTLHGAGVEGAGQRNQYSPKEWAYVVAPTNRRAFGFDWEDWGRKDAIEVLNLAQYRFQTNPQRTWLTGHSMGGHGTWHIGVTFPDRFAAIGPSAAWISFWSYTGAARYDGGTGIENIMTRATSASDTLAIKDNFKQQGVYILHGDRDDNVPVAQARTMVKKLAEFHRSFVYHEQPGAGHWWGAPCCDWPPMMEFFQHREIPDRKNVKRVEFVTASPGVSSTCHWVMIDNQLEASRPSKVDLSLNTEERKLTGTTQNVARLKIDVSGVDDASQIVIELDGKTLEGPVSSSINGELWIERSETGWKTTAAPSPMLKGAHRYGPFKEAFNHRMLFVYGTIGNDEENEWSYNKARFDAETFWYRGNGSIDIVADTDFTLGDYPDRSVIIYGNATTNKAWNMLLADGPIQFERGRVVIDGKELSGDSYAGLFIQPRHDSDIASVGVVTGTGIHGMKLTTKLPYFVSGIAYPDFFIIDENTLTKGFEGIVCAGFFGTDWKISPSDISWREELPTEE